MSTFQLIFSFQGTDGSPTGPDPENMVGDLDTGSPSMPVSSGLQCPVSRGIVVQKQDLLGELLSAFFSPFRMSFICTNRDE
jgi:hypothetical protein